MNQSLPRHSPPYRRILALESSCDDTACAIVEDGRRVLASRVVSQTQRHAQFGGVIPEHAARDHLVAIHPLIAEILESATLGWDDIDAVAATLGPGLVGALLTGAVTAKTLSWALNKPFVGVNHLDGHVCANFLDSDLKPPFLCLLVSGGHTQLMHVSDYGYFKVVGHTLDDAVGEAYDKIGRVLGLSFPGGPAIDKLAAQGDPKTYALPKARTKQPFDFSFSGLKTATMRCDERLNGTEPLAPDVQANIAASFQHTVVETLVTKALACAKALDLDTIAVCGGVSANTGLRERFNAEAQQRNLNLYVPGFAYCTDNAAMIASAAHFCPLTQDVSHEVFSRA